MLLIPNHQANSVILVNNADHPKKKGIRASHREVEEAKKMRESSIEKARVSKRVPRPRHNLDMPMEMFLCRT